jgi:hypothetical protein
MPKKLDSRQKHAGMTSTGPSSPSALVGPSSPSALVGPSSPSALVGDPGFSNAEEAGFPPEACGNDEHGAVIPECSCRAVIPECSCRGSTFFAGAMWRVECRRAGFPPGACGNDECGGRHPRVLLSGNRAFRMPKKLDSRQKQAGMTSTGPSSPSALVGDPRFSPAQCGGSNAEELDSRQEHAGMTNAGRHPRVLLSGRHPRVLLSGRHPRVLLSGNQAFRMPKKLDSRQKHAGMTNTGAVIPECACPTPQPSALSPDLSPDLSPACWATRPADWLGPGSSGCRAGVCSAG